MDPDKLRVKKSSHLDSKRLKKEKKKWKVNKLLKNLAKTSGTNSSEDTLVESINEEDNTFINDISTLSIAVPGSILENAQSPELRTYLAGQIARAAGVFKVDEIVVFDDIGAGNIADSKKQEDLDDDGKPVRHSCLQLARILQYLECPQYLRKYFFPIHKDLQYAGLLNPLDLPHHLRQNDEFPFREGITTNLPSKSGRGSVVNCGLLKDVIVDRNLEPGIRVTVKLKPHEGSKKMHGIIVPPSLPRTETGTYWGYTVRVAQSLGAVFSQSPYSSGYDLTIGTSERGESIDKVALKSLPEHHHAVVVFGGLQGLEAALDNDEILTVDDPALLFDYYLNTCPEQGSRTIRTEEAILISLAALRTKLNPKFFKIPDSQ